VILVTNNHRASLANAAPEGDPLTVALSDGTRIQDVLADHVRTASPVGAAPRPCWRFLPMPGTTADPVAADRDRWRMSATSRSTGPSVWASTTKAFASTGCISDRL
jgi:hypothetical protein